MKIFISFFILLLISITATASNNVEITCWQRDKLIFHKNVTDVFNGDTYISAFTKKFTYIIVGADCLIKYPHLK